MSNPTKEEIILNIRQEVDNLLREKPKSHGKIIEKIINLTEISKEVIGYSDPDYLRILDALDTGFDRLLELNSVRETSALTDAYLDVLLGFNEKELVERSNKAVSKLFSKNETTYHVIAEDIINRVSDHLEDQENLDLLGRLFVDTGHFLFKRKNFEQSVAYFERGLNFYVDSGNSEIVTKEITNILELARRLAIKNNEYSINYVELVNRVSSDAGIDLKNNLNAQLAYQSYSEHLLKRSKNMVEERKVVPGRLHKKKRDFSNLFKKKEEEDEFY